MASKTAKTGKNTEERRPREQKSAKRGLTDGEEPSGNSEPLKKKRAIEKSKITSLLPSTSRPEQTLYDDSIGHMDQSLLADHFAKAIRKHLTQYSVIEVEERHIPSKAFRDTTTFEKPRLAKNLPDFLISFSPGGEVELKECEAKGTPHTLLIAQSGIRTADLVRELKHFNSDQSRVAKCFSKHMKLAENIKFLQSTPTGIIVGTPTRLKELAEKAAMDTHKLKRVVIDASYLDEKKRTILDMKEIFVPLLELMNFEGLKLRYGDREDNIQVLVF